MDPGDKPEPRTEAHERNRRSVRRFRLTVIAGPATGAAWVGAAERCGIGAHPSNDLVLADPTVSRFHCEVSIAGDAVRVRDLGSRNGTIASSIRIAEAMVSDSTVVVLGGSHVLIAIEDVHHELAASDRVAFGSLVGASAVMREVFGQLERFARSELAVLVEGETGTGKEGAAVAIHDASPRAAGPFVVIDCGAIAGNLLESELFGHEAGAFSGATARRIGAFEEASGGTVFLDEIGELPLELQPKLLRVLETHEIRRVGGTASIPCDLRIVAATHRDLRGMVNRGTFRPDLYFRLAAAKIVVPPLRERTDDLALLVDHVLADTGAPPATIAKLTSPESIAALAAYDWPGNVRELRNHVERCVAFGELLVPGAPVKPRPAPARALATYDVAREHALDEFERAYVTALLAHHAGNVAAAAKSAAMNRAYLYRLVRRHGLR